MIPGKPENKPVDEVYSPKTEKRDTEAEWGLQCQRAASLGIHLNVPIELANYENPKFYKFVNTTVRAILNLLESRKHSLVAHVDYDKKDEKLAQLREEAQTQIDQAVEYFKSPDPYV